MQCLHQVEVPVEIYIATYDGPWPCQVRCGPEGRMWTSFSICKTFGPAPKASQVSKTGLIWPLQADIMQQFGHLVHIGHNTIDRHRKHCSHILITDVVLQQPDLRLSFVAALVQYVHDLQQLSLQNYYCLTNLSLVWWYWYKFTVSLLFRLSGPVCWSLCSGSPILVLEHSHSNCHLYDDWRLAGHEENLFDWWPAFFLLKCPSVFQAGLPDLCSCLFIQPLVKVKSTVLVTNRLCMRLTFVLKLVYVLLSFLQYRVWEQGK